MRCLTVILMIFVATAHAARVTPRLGGANAYTVYCGPYWSRNLACTPAMWQALMGYLPGKPANPALKVPAMKAPAWGTTLSEIQSNFPTVIVQNFKSNQALETQIATIQPVMMARLSTEMARLDTTGAYRPALYTAAAMHLSAKSLHLLRSGFGPVLDTYVADYAPAAVKQAYQAIKPYVPTYGSAYYNSSHAGSAALPASTMAYYDVFLDDYTGTSDTVQVSLKHMQTYVQIRTNAGVLEVVGGISAVLGVISFFDPNAWEDFKAWVSDWYASQSAQVPPYLPSPYGAGYPSPSVVPTTDINPDGAVYDPDLDEMPSLVFGPDSFSPLCTADAC